MYAAPLSSHVDSKTVQLWTIHPASAWIRIKRTEKVKNDLPVSDDETTAIEWLRDQVSVATGVPPGSPLLWTWYAAHGTRRKRPDLRSSGWLPTGTKAVLAQLAVPAAYVLAMQFGMWCLALSGIYIVSDEAESLADQKRARGELRQVDVIKSWHRMFDLTFGDEAEWGPIDARPIQAVVPAFRRDWVVSEVEFISR
jgi:hypothetical protein